MTGFHLLLGLAVVLLNGAGGVLALAKDHGTQEIPSIAVWGHAALVLQLTSGFFLFTATTEAPGFTHYLSPAAALATIVAARAVGGEQRVEGGGGAGLCQRARPG